MAAELRLTTLNEVSPSAPRETLIARAARFAAGWPQRDFSRVVDGNINTLFEDLKEGMFWRVLTRLDGTPPGADRYLEGYSATHARAWARGTFTSHELNELFGLCVDFALTGPLDYGPKNYHSLLLWDTLDKPGSIFADSIGSQLRRRLVNGRFWEELPSMMRGLNGGISYTWVEPILASGFPEFDPDFVQEGWRLFCADRGKESGFDLEMLSGQAVLEYGRIVKQVYLDRGACGLTDEDLGYLIKPYILCVAGRMGQDREERAVAYEELLREEIVQRYLATSEYVRDELAKSLESVMSNVEDGSDLDWIVAVLKLVSDPREMFDRMVEKVLSPYHLYSLDRQQREHGVYLDVFMSPRARAKIAIAVTKHKPPEVKKRRRRT